MNINVLISVNPKLSIVIVSKVRKARAAFKRETEISKQLEELDYKICNTDNLSNIDDILNEYENKQ